MRLANWVRILGVVAASVSAAVILTTSTTSAYPLRSPQVSFQSTQLQAFLNTWDGGVNVTTQQLLTPYFQVSSSGNADVTLMAKMTGLASGNSVGVYNTTDPNNPPALFQIFPAAATPGWYANCTFKSSGMLIVSLFDNNTVYQGQTTFTGVDRNHVGFYLFNNSRANPFYSEDGRNSGGSPQVLTYQGTGANALDLWMCFEDSPYVPTIARFVGAILEVESMVPTPALNASWGSLKALYR